MGVGKVLRAQLVALLLIAFFVANARADDQITPLAQNGDWIALQHAPSVTDPPDVCLAVNPNANFAIRADDTDVEFRLTNTTWALPTDVTGTLELDVNGNKYALHITSNTNTSIAAEVENDQLLKIITDMNKAASMTVVAGTAAPVQVSLSGSNTVITAFLTCANIQAPSQGGGANPFAGPASQ
jgi:hypothetical protein